MRRAVARGRMFPQSYSTDRRYGRLSIKAIGLFPLMWANADDQGRLCGDPEEIKYSCCPNIDHITKQDIPILLQELQDNQLINRYITPKSMVIQMLDWWDANQKMQWAWPSEYPPADDWYDHLRYKKDAKTVCTVNWPVSGETDNDSQVRVYDLSGETPGEEDIAGQVSGISSSPEDSGEDNGSLPLTTPSVKNNIKDKDIRGRGRGNSPEDSGEPAPSGISPQVKGLYGTLEENFKMRWGTVRAKEPDKIVPRKINAKERAQLRDLAVELAGAGYDQDAMIIKQAFDEAAGARKFYISYVKAILLDWLGIERDHLPGPDVRHSPIKNMRPAQKNRARVKQLRK
jgi:hypothetical protein